MSQRNTRRDSVCISLEEKHKAKEKALAQAESEKHKQKGDKEKEKSSNLFYKEFDKFKTEIKELFLKFEESMDRKLSKLDEKCTSIFEDLKKEISTINTEVRDTKEEVKELQVKVSDLEKSVTYQAETQEEFADLQNDKYNKVNYELEEMKRKVMLLEKYDRKYNLLFYGITEGEGEDVKSKMKTFFTDTLEIDKEKVEAMQFIHCHRIPSEGKGPKPVIVRFLSFEDRELIYSKELLPALRDNKQRILTDLPVEMKRTRARLAKEAYKIRKEELLKTRIKEKGLSVYLEVRKTKEDSWERRDV